ncbi:pyruvate dehydrogenase (acetyl-transferring) E1 component subunit alpha [Mycoplasmopsis agassizii]|uniref:pyruvate dehydrogenase (acetyl-transferring) E1 component subunit alpha n=1 Tax=Mycoplasmopsis agassizii TaxID=33922 RepID=UPI00352972A7
MSKKFKYVFDGHVMSDKKELIRFLDVEGNLTKEGKEYLSSKSKEDKAEPLSTEKLLEAYSYMVKSREMDTYMTQLQKQGRMLTFAPNFGEEALQVATSSAMDPKVDWMIPAFRSNATMLQLGVPMVHQMLYWNGSEQGNRIPDGVNVTPIAIVIGAQYSHASGVGYGMKLAKKANPSSKMGVAVTIVGNGGTSEGETYESMNMASVQGWPVVYTVNNNQWAISTPVKDSTTVAISGKAHAVGIVGVRVDGNDLLASYAVMKEAIEYARENSRPVLVEFVTWRQGVHTSSDNPRIYRTEAEEKEQEKWEPFHRIKKYMFDNGICSEEKDKELVEKVQAEVKAAYEKSLSIIDNEGIDEIFDYTYAELPKHLVEQKAHAKKYSSKGAK